MKIPLLTSLNEGEDYLNSVVVLKTPRKILRTTFILDTGSPTTILSYLDARRLQIPFNPGAKTNIIRLGGSKYQGYSFGKITFLFRSEDNKLIKEDFPVCVVRPTSPKEIDELSSFPTIMGTDFLKIKKYTLFCDMDKGVAFLEKKVEKSEEKKE